MGAALRGQCWGFAVADHGRLELKEPATCPPAPRNADRVNLDLYVTTGGKAAAHLSSGASTAFANLDELSAYLVVQKTTAALGGYARDLVLAVDDQATIATLTSERSAWRTPQASTSATWSATTTDELRALTR